MRGDIPSVLLTVLLGFLLAGLCFLYLWQGLVLARLRAERAELVLALENLERKKLLLEHQLRAAYSLEVLEDRARALGMGPVDPSRLHFLLVDGDDH